MDKLREIRHWCVAIRPLSPGDLFRLLHGIRVCFGDEPSAIICDANTLILTEELWCNSELSRSTKYTVATVRIDETLHWVCPHQLTNPCLRDEYRADQIVDAWHTMFPKDPLCFGDKTIWTSYSDHRNSKFKKLVEKQQNVTIRRIDTKKHNPEFFRHTFQTPVEFTAPRSDQLKMAVILRNTGSHDWRYSPPYHYDRDFFAEFDVDIWCGGLRTKECYPAAFRDQCIPFAGQSFRQQIEKAMDFDIVVGVNSSALDVFAAGGRMIVREAVFQGFRPPQWPGGWRFNSFLGIAPNVELRIAKTHLDNNRWHNPKRMANAIHAAIAYAKSTAYPIGVGKPMLKGFAHESEAEQIKTWLSHLLPS